MIAISGSRTSGNKTASGQVISNNVKFVGIIIATDGSNDVTFSVYKGNSAQDENAILPKNIKIKGDENYGGIVLKHPVKCEGGIYVSISGGSFNYVVHYTEYQQ